MVFLALVRSAECIYSKFASWRYCPFFLLSTMGNANSSSKSGDDIQGGRSNNAFLSLGTTHHRRRSAVSDRASAPPPYSAAVHVSSPSTTSPPTSDDAPRGSLFRKLSNNSQENALEMLRQVNTVIVVDDSSSMEGALWTEVRIKCEHSGI